MLPTSEEQFRASAEGSVPGLEQVRDRTWALAVPMPAGHIPYSLCYLLQDSGRGIHVIDPGWESDDNWALLGSALESLGFRIADVASVTVTHLHPDHIGAAARLRDQAGAPVAVHRIEAEAMRALADGVGRIGRDSIDGWGVPADRRADLDAAASGAPADSIPPTVDVLLEDGDALAIPGRDVRVLHTPGHTAGHVCLADTAESLLFTGDHVLPTVFPGLGLGGPSGRSPIADYLSSLDRVAAFDDHEVVPGHGYRFTGLAGRCEDIGAHHRRRTGEVAAALAAEPGASAWKIAGRLTWTAGWENLSGFHLVSALAQTAMHVEYLARA